MNVFHKVALQTLKRNKTRTIVTIIGIILSAAMITAVTSLIASLQGYLIASTVAVNGDWHGLIHNLPATEVATLATNKEVSAMGIMQNKGYARLNDSQNEYMPYLFVAALDDELFSMLSPRLLTGRLPQSSSELLLPEHLATNGGVEHQLGDQLTLQIGRRVSDGQDLNQLHAYRTGKDDPGEKLVLKQTQTYTVVGFIERPRFERYNAPGYTAMTRVSASLAETDTAECYVKLKSPGNTYAFLESNFDSWSTHGDLLMYLGVTRHRAFSMLLFSFAAILIALIMFGSISLIYNAFAISVSERSKQFGLLASVGATKGQLRRSINFEAFLVSAIGIPLGVLSGLLGIGVTLHFVGPMFDAIFMDSGASLKLVGSVPAIAIAAAVSLLTVFISAANPARKASKVAPIDAIRQTSDIAVRPKQVKTSRLTTRLFGLPGMLARKNFKRQKGKHKSTIISLTLSIVLFISAVTYTSYLKTSTGFMFNETDIDITYASYVAQTSPEEADHIYELLSNVPGVKQSLQYNEINAHAALPQALINPEFLGHISTDEEQASDSEEGYFRNYFVPDDVYQALAKKAGIASSKLTDQNLPQAIAYDRMILHDSKTGKITFTPFLNEHQAMPVRLVFGSEASRFEQDVQIAAFTNELPAGLTDSGHQINLILPASQWRHFAQDVKSSYARSIMSFQVEDHATTYSQMEEVLRAAALDASRLTNLAADLEDDRNMLIIINVFAYGFIALISLIAIANVFNTIYTNIQLRRREFAMLKSVGMTPRDFDRMMRFESGMYVLQAALYGLPLAYGVTYLIYFAAIQGVSVDFIVPWKVTFVAIAAVVTIVFATNAYAMRSVKQENIVDALQNENL